MNDGPRFAALLRRLNDPAGLRGRIDAETDALQRLVRAHPVAVWWQPPGRGGRPPCLAFGLPPVDHPDGPGYVRVFDPGALQPYVDRGFVLADDAVEVVSPEWLQEMLRLLWEIRAALAALSRFTPPAGR